TLARPSRMLLLAYMRLGVRGATVQLFSYRPKHLTLRAVPRVSFVPSFETCPAALARPSRMLPLACTRLGVRGAVRLGVLGLRTVLADEWCVGLEFCLAPCLAQRTGAPDPLHVWARATVLVPLLCGSCVSYPVVWYPCLTLTFPLRSPLVGLPGEFQDTPVVLPVSALCAATVACVRVLFSLVRCTRLGWDLRSPSVPQMIRFLGKTPAAVSFESFPSRGASAARRAGSVTDATWLILPVVICLSQRLSHACVIKKLVVGPWVGPIGPPSVCTGRLVPSASDALLALTGRVVPLAL
ncbi:hypothetical protein S245_060323, partial [Arachis hypogaea]